ncbi:MAG TPA: hypothetical protein VMH28_09275 [Candidatus Acidoferrales bacterium]|nr:hypothetical protein [Candidatus Acidoferrales bacterium]
MDALLLVGPALALSFGVTTLLGRALLYAVVAAIERAAKPAK